MKSNGKKAPKKTVFKKSKANQITIVSENRAFTLAGAADFLGINRARVNQLIKAGRFCPIEPLYGAGEEVTRHIAREDDLLRFKTERAKAASARLKK